jgi:folylpolyglutamate synthase/dihydropteroate synthase
MNEITEHTLTAKIAEVSVPSRLGVKNTLGPITALMDHLGHPELKFPSVHIGGTSGKGSTATFIANILVEAGYRVGLFTKPHLSSVRERFVINVHPITGEDMLELIERVGRYEAEKPTWFELMTALAFQYFHEQQVDLGVIEVGLDGAHSPPKMTALAEALRSLFPGQRITGVLAFSQGHDAAATLSVLAPLLSRAILTSFNAIGDYGSRRAQPPESLVALLAERFPNVEQYIEPDPFRAIELAKRMTSPEDLVCVTGSIFLVGQVRPALVK